MSASIHPIRLLPVAQEAGMQLAIAATRAASVDEALQLLGELDFSHGRFGLDSLDDFLLGASLIPANYGEPKNAAESVSERVEGMTAALISWAERDAREQVASAGFWPVVPLLSILDDLDSPGPLDAIVGTMSVCFDGSKTEGVCRRALVSEKHLLSPIFRLTLRALLGVDSASPTAWMAEQHILRGSIDFSLVRRIGELQPFTRVVACCQLDSFVDAQPDLDEHLDDIVCWIREVLSARDADVPPILSSTAIWSPIPRRQGDWT
jgi:hypothetical protein